MEQLNRVELRGIVGSVRESNVSGRVITRLTVATNYAFRAQDGTPVIETTWHNVTIWSDKSIGMAKCDKVEVIGRLRHQRYVDATGEDRSFVEIVAKEVRKIDTELKMEE